MMHHALYIYYLREVLSKGVPLRERWSARALANRMIAMAEENGDTELNIDSAIWIAMCNSNAS